MCLLTFIPEYTDINLEHLSNGAENNPDGFGWAIHTGRAIASHSGLNYDAVVDRFIEARKTHKGHALFHSRITTHGGTSLDNCHPFQVGRDGQSVVAHNGMLPIDAKGGKSDTRIFAEELFPSWGGVATLNSKKMRKRLAKFASGSKLVFLSANPDVNHDFVIINEKDGHWADGVWWSNGSYKYGRPARSYSYGGAWYTDGYITKHSGKVYLPDDESPEWWVDSTNGVQDVTFVDEHGEEVWGEIWTCAHCGAEEYINDMTINTDAALACYSCNSCWYCGDDADRNCICVHNTSNRSALSYPVDTMTHIY